MGINLRRRRRETAERAKMASRRKVRDAKRKGTEPQEKTRMVREGTERIMAPRRKVREAIRRGREPQEKTRMVREGTERRMTPRRTPRKRKGKMDRKETRTKTKPRRKEGVIEIT